MFGNNMVLKLIRELTEQELHVIYHSSGLEQSRKMYRDYYCTYVDEKLINGLVKRSLFYGPRGVMKNAWGTNKEAGYFYLTKLGKQIAITIKRAQNSSKSKMVRTG